MSQSASPVQFPGSAAAGRFNHIPRVSSGFLLSDLLLAFVVSLSNVVHFVFDCTQSAITSKDPEDTDIYTVESETCDFISLLCGRL